MGWEEGAAPLRGKRTISTGQVGGPQNALCDAPEEEAADSATAVRTDQNEVRTPLRRKFGDDASRRSYRALL